LFEPCRIVLKDEMIRTYKRIIKVIKDRTENTENKVAIDYYEAVRIAYTESEYMKKYLNTTIKEDVKEIDKTFKPI
jgi:hypothetical protein